MTQPNIEQAITKLATWQTAQAELALLETALGEAMMDYANTLGEPPRQLIIEAERKREQVRQLFETATEALDALSIARTGHTNFGNLG